MLNRCALALLACIALLSWQAPAQAQTEGLPIGWAWSMADGELTLTLEGFDQMEDLRVRVTRTPSRQVYTFDRSALGLGQQWDVQFPAPDRTSRFAIRVDADFAGEAGFIEDGFEIEVLAPMDFEVDLDSFEADARRFSMTMTQPADYVELIVRGDTGDIVAERVVQFDGEPAGTTLDVSWTQAPGGILTIDVKAVGTTGEWSSRQYVPWEVAFDAAYINFESGSSELPAGDLPMLRERLAEILQTASRVQEWVAVKLYVAGYTDTVGSTSDNQRLSEARARELGAFFRSEGVGFPIFFQGFGESGLAVDTADNVDEPENRRSVFILSTRAPSTSSHVPRSNWRELP